jgi:DNA-binding beta-propeller fold protein YncE
MLMTVPVLFRAFVLSPDGTMNWFGKASSAPGGFNIAGGIARDSRGNFLIIDRLKGAVQIFDAKFAFVTQFSTRGYKPGQLIFPDDLAVDGRDRVYVTQMGKRGISVFTLEYARGA